VEHQLSESYLLHDNLPRWEETTLPTRVIDVDTKNTEQLVSLHIGRPQEKGKYTALSYQWGGAQQIATITANIQTLKSGIPINTLSQTVQDAIKVTRDLRFRYLWVDALCILQDDSADKIAEINRMGAIYKHSTMTIAAAKYSKQREFIPRR
jgi:hypothetical protein